MKIYVDINIIANFSKRYIELYNSDPKQTLNDHWVDFVISLQFTKLEVNPDGLLLLEYLKTLNAQIYLLSATGSESYHMNVASQRNLWLSNNKLLYPVEHIVSKYDKINYVNRHNIIVDLDNEVVSNSAMNDGVAIQYTDLLNTITHIETEYKFYEKYIL